MSSHPSVHCPSLSTTFVGVQHPVSSPECPIQQFRGIKYATVPGRFRQSILNNSYPAVTDAKSHGPIAPQIKRNNLDDPLFGFIREEPFPVVQDEFECLNLVITRPGGISADASLPVMVWIHGGSNVIGSGSHYLCDPGRLVLTSVEVDQPVIVVSINYRLGLFGFAASEALEEANRLLGDVGVGNYGLNDQLNALAWIRRHISSFGGNPSNLTLFGESAGAIDIHALLLSHTHQTKPIATRAILQSGVLRPPAVQSVRNQGAILTRLMSRLRLNTIDDLRKCSVDDLVLNTPATMQPTDDGVFFRPSWRSNPTPTNIASVIIGDCAYESILWTPSVLLWSSVSLIRRIRAVIRGIYKADTFLRTYGLTWSTDDEEAQQAAFNILNDTHFAWPADRVARATKERGEVEVFRYVFDQESPFTFMAHHAVDLLYLFDNISPKGPVRKIPTFDSSGSDTSNESDYDSEGGTSPDSFDAIELAERENYFQISDFSYNAKRVTQSLQEKWIAFANSSKPWRPESLFVFGPEGEVGERPLEDELAVRRRVEQWDVALEGVDQEVVYRLGVELGNGPGHRAR